MSYQKSFIAHDCTLSMYKFPVAKVYQRRMLSLYNLHQGLNNLCALEFNSASCSKEWYWAHQLFKCSSTILDCSLRHYVAWILSNENLAMSDMCRTRVRHTSDPTILFFVYFQNLLCCDVFVFVTMQYIVGTLSLPSSGCLLRCGLQVPQPSCRGIFLILC